MYLLGKSIASEEGMVNIVRSTWELVERYTDNPKLQAILKEELEALPFS
jgi:hypothetical protein